MEKLKKYWIPITAVVVSLVIIVTIVILVNRDDKPVDEKKNTVNMTYEVITDLNLIYELPMTITRHRGYEVVQKDGDYYLIIHHGEESSWFSKLEVVSVEVEGNIIKAHVKLPENEGAGDAFSYPKAVIKLDNNPKGVDVRDSYGRFKEL